MRPGVTAAVALAGASVIAITPVAPPPPPENHVTSAEVRLAAASVSNIPINLIQDIINIPYNEVQGMNTLGESLLFTGTWVWASSTNVWGTDPGDPGHYYGLANLFPFPAFSNSLAAQITGVAAVLLPINSGCNNIACPDGSALLRGWFQPARIWTLLTTGKYTFDATPVANPDGTTHPPEGLWNFGGPVTWGADYGHPEWDTKTDPVTGQPVVPWAGTTFTFNPLAPFSDYLTHLMSDPTSPDNAIKFPTPDQISTAVWNLAAGLFVAFSPIFPGSPWCLGLCGPPSAMQPPFFYDPPPTNLPPPFSWFLPGTTTTSITQNPAPAGVNALTGDPETQLKAKVIEKDPQSTITSALGFNPPPLNNTPVEPEETSSVDALTPPTGLNQGLPPLPGSGTQTPESVPSNDTVRKPGFVPRLVNRFLPHPSGAKTTDSATKTTDPGANTTPGSGANTTPGSGANTPDSETKKTDSETKKKGSETKKTGSGSGTSTGAHSGGGSAG